MGTQGLVLLVDADGEHPMNCKNDVPIGSDFYLAVDQKQQKT